jgi:hypothetical protein
MGHWSFKFEGQGASRFRVMESQWLLVCFVSLCFRIGASGGPWDKYGHKCLSIISNCIILISYIELVRWGPLDKVPTLLLLLSSYLSSFITLPICLGRCLDSLIALKPNRCPSREYMPCLWLLSFSVFFFFSLSLSRTSKSSYILYY